MCKKANLVKKLFKNEKAARKVIRSARKGQGTTVELDGNKVVVSKLTRVIR